MKDILKYLTMEMVLILVLLNLMEKNTQTLKQRFLCLDHQQIMMIQKKEKLAV